MGYDVHVTKTRIWFQSKSYPLSLTEWKDLVLRDPSMHLVNEIQSDSELSLSYINDGIAVWTLDVEAGGKNTVYFNYKDGRVMTKNPDKVTICKLKEIAGKLNAFVIGDDGEEY